jgi:hypothetical protein
MSTSPISALHHPALIDQTERDPHRNRDDETARHRHPAPQHRPHPPAPADQAPASTDEHRTTGLLIDVRG